MVLLSGIAWRQHLLLMVVSAKLLADTENMLQVRGVPPILCYCSAACNCYKRHSSHVAITSLAPDPDAEQQVHPRLAADVGALKAQHPLALPLKRCITLAAQHHLLFAPCTSPAFLLLADAGSLRTALLPLALPLVNARRTMHSSTLFLSPTHLL